MSIFATRLKQLREDRELSQRAFGKAIGFGSNTIFQWESDMRTPDINSLLKICNFFDVSADYLIGRTNVE